MENISIVAAPAPVYNFEVEGTHTYYVSGANVLVHNAKCGGPKDRNSTVNDLVHGRLKRKLPGQYSDWTYQEILDALKTAKGNEKRILQSVKKLIEDSVRLLDKVGNK